MSHGLIMYFFSLQLIQIGLSNFRAFLGSGCSTGGRALTSNTRDPLFESSHRQYYLLSSVLKIVLKDENKEKRSREWPNFLREKTLDFLLS